MLSTGEAHIKFVLRFHERESDSSRLVTLPGYGVELAIKDTEYRAEDDQKRDDQASESAEDREQAEATESEDVHGLFFRTLRKIYPERRQSLNELREHLLRAGSELVQLKQWQMQDLSFQATARIGAALDDPLQALKILRHISQNFPLQALPLTRTKVSEALRSEIETNQEVFAQYHGVGEGESFVLLNGMSVDVELTDVYQLYDMMLREAKTMQTLHALGFGSEQIRRLLRLDLK